MSKRKVVVCSLPDSLGDVSERQLQWDKCCICQQVSGTLICPADNPVENIKNQGYKSMSTNLSQLKPFNYKLDSGRNVSSLDEGEGIEACLLKHKAKWHKNCALKFSATKLEAILTRLKVKQEADSSSAQPENAGRHTPKTRSSSTPVRMKENKCFLCLGPETRTHQLCLCATKDITEKVKLCATALSETRIVGLIETGGDLVAMEAKYHKSCLTQLYNKHRCIANGPNTQNSSRLLCENIAFAELVVYIENNLASNSQYIFEMGSLCKTYQSRIADLEKIDKCEISLEHSTRLRGKLLNYFPNLTAEKWGNRYVLKSRTANLMPNILREDQDGDAIAFHRFVKSVRKSISETKTAFEGTFPVNCEEMSIPGPLLAAVSTLLYGVSQTELSGATRPLLTICQLVMQNFHESVPQGAVVRHKRHRETPFPLVMGLSCYVRSRDKALLDLLHQRGVSVSYDRVTEITSQLCRLAVQRALDENVVCPSNLKRNIFTVTALDNIDVKSRSNTSMFEFHGTGISVFQCPLKENEGDTRLFRTSFNDVRRKGDRSVPNLPDFYSYVPDAILPNENPAPHGLHVDSSILDMLSPGDLSTQWKKEEPWLNSVCEYLQDSSNNEAFNFTWSSFHASIEEANLTGNRVPSINALLPLFHEKSTSIGMIKHGMNIARDLTEHLNKDQIPVMCFDQQLYTIAKKIQWQWPTEYGEKKYVLTMGPLHIEQSFLRVLGQFLEGSGWTTILTHSGISTAGSAEALQKVTQIKRAREIHQITASVLYSLAVDEYRRCNPEEEVSFDAWLEETAKSSPTFKFWLTVLNLEIILLSFVRSVRLGNFIEFQDSMKKMVPWYFIFDHQNYSRWLSVHLMDLEQLPQTAPSIHSLFLEGRFVVHKTTNLFNGLGIDHAHEQNNAIVKGKGGAVGLTHDPSALRRWTIGGPEVSRLLNEFDNDVDDEAYGPHHEQKDSYQIRVLEHTIALKDAFVEYENPFSIRGSDLITLDTRAALSEEGVASFLNAEDKGLRMYIEFVKDRLIDQSKSVYDPIKKCQTKIFACKKKPAKTSNLQSLKSDLSLFSRSFIVSVARNMDLDKFFEHENQVFPPSLTLNGAMRTGDKMQLTLLLEKLICKQTAEPLPDVFDGVIIDGAVMVHSVQPRPDIRTFCEYVSQIDSYLRSFVTKLGVKRVDVAWDLYLRTSLKQATRNSRGAGVRRVDLPTKGKLPSNWPDYLRNDLNKEELFQYLSKALLERFQNIQFVTNVDSTIRASDPGKSSLHGVSCTSMEEADGRILLHLQDAVEGGAQKMIVRSSDTDVLVLLVSFFPKLRQKGLQQIWLQYGAGTKKRYINVHKISSTLGDQKSEALRGFHAFTGCDFTSFFCGKGKRTAWAAWDDSLTEAFACIAHPLEDVDESVYSPLERFTVKMYGARAEAGVDYPKINQARKNMFASDSKHVSAIPPTAAAFRQHVRRAAYVAGHIWGNATNSVGTLRSPEGWGWALKGEEWEVIWTTLPEVWKAVRALDRCGCTTGCLTQRCSCRRSNLSCSPACKTCKGECNNKSAEDDDLTDVIGDP